MNRLEILLTIFLLIFIVSFSGRPVTFLNRDFMLVQGFI